eukprot:scaffold3596_cov126-Cylindrotheca_fusiformis.AAC.12
MKLLSFALIIAVASSFTPCHQVRRSVVVSASNNNVSEFFDNLFSKENKEKADAFLADVFSKENKEKGEKFLAEVQKAHADFVDSEDGEKLRQEMKKVQDKVVQTVQDSETREKLMGELKKAQEQILSKTKSA